jgi:Fe2+ transport system protein B
MDPISGISGAAKGIRELTKAGKELDGAIGELNEFTNQPLKEQHNLRVEAERRKRLKPLHTDQKAFARLVEKKNMEAEREKIKQEALKRYGKTAYDELRTIVSQIEKEEELEKKAFDKDADKLLDLKLMSVAFAVIVTYILHAAGLI